MIIFGDVLRQTDRTERVYLWGVRSNDRIFLNHAEKAFAFYRIGYVSF